MNRFFVEAENINEENSEITITKEDTKHISKVLRLCNGDIIEVCDGENYEYKCEINNINAESVKCTIKEKREIQSESELEVVLYQSIPKSNKIDLIIQKSTELGIKKIVPIITQRTIVNFKNEKEKQKKRLRWQKIAKESSKQSKRGVIPEVNSPLEFEKALEEIKNTNKNIVAYENSKNKSIKELLNSYKGIKSIGVWIGPEGGFEKGEIECLQDIGVEVVGLGKRILRAETASITSLSIVMYELGDLGGLE